MTWGAVLVDLAVIAFASGAAGFVFGRRAGTQKQRVRLVIPVPGADTRKRRRLFKRLYRKSGPLREGAAP